MARYRKIDPRIWNDAKFCSFSERGKLLFFYVLTHPNMTMIGMLRATPEGLFSELGFDASACQADWQAVCEAGVVQVAKQGLIRLPNFLKYNEPESPSVVKSWASCFDLLPECDLLNDAKRDIESYLIQKGKSWIAAYRGTKKQPNGQAGRQAAKQTAKQTARHQEQEQEQDIRNTKETQMKPASRKSDDFRVSVFPKIVSKYNSILGDKLPKVSAQSDKRIEKCRKWANALYREKGCKSQDELLVEAEKFFRQVLRCPFLLGEAGGDRHWRADFDFLMTEKGRIGVLEGKYDGHAQAPASSPNIFTVPSSQRRMQIAQAENYEPDFDLGSFGVAK